MRGESGLKYGFVQAPGKVLKVLLRGHIGILSHIVEADPGHLTLLTLKQQRKEKKLKMR